jgi:hypothetical protein
MYVKHAKNYFNNVSNKNIYKNKIECNYYN